LDGRSSRVRRHSGRRCRGRRRRRCGRCSNGAPRRTHTPKGAAAKYCVAVVKEQINGANKHDLTIPPHNTPHVVRAYFVTASRLHTCSAQRPRTCYSNRDNFKRRQIHRRVSHQRFAHRTSHRCDVHRTVAIEINNVHSPIYHKHQTKKNKHKHDSILFVGSVLVCVRALLQQKNH
jgi:hypothetical protein